MDWSLRKLFSTGCPAAVKSADRGRVKLTFPKFMLHPTGSPGLVQAVPLESVPVTTFWSMLIVLSSCRLRTAGASTITNDDLSLFVQDQWQPSRGLTVNYGLRWDAQRMPETVDPATTAFAAYLKNPLFPS